MATKATGTPQRNSIHRSASSPTFLTSPHAITGPLNPGGTVLAGFLWKRSRAHPQRWLRRHFRYDGHNLTYHHSASITSPPRLTLPVERITRVVASPRPLVGIGVNVFDIWVTGGELPLEVAARTRNGMDEWVTTLSRDIGARLFAGTASAAAKRRATVGASGKASVSFEDGGGTRDRDPGGQPRRTSGPDTRAEKRLAMPTLPPLPFSIDAFEPLWDTTSRSSVASGKLGSASTATGSKTVQKARNDESATSKAPPPSRFRDNSTVPLPPLEKLNANLPDLPVLPANVLVPPVRTATGSRPPVGALPKTPVKETAVAAKKPTTSPGHKRRGMIGSHSTTDLVAIPPMPTPTRPSARPVNDPPRTTAPIARSTEGAPLAMAPIHRFKSAEKLQALIMALHDSTEFARPDGSFSSTFDAADRLMQDLPPIPDTMLTTPAPSAAGAVAKPPAPSAVPTVFAMPARPSVNTRVLPPTIITNAISPPRVHVATTGTALAKASAVPTSAAPVSAAPQSAADSPDSSSTITKPEIPSPSDAANSTAASTAINQHAATATTATDVAAGAAVVVAATASVPSSPSAPSPVPCSMYAESPLVASLDPHVAPRAQRIAVLTKVVDIVRHGTALHQRLVSEEEGDTAATTSGRGPTTASSAASVTNLAALTKARRKALDEYRVSVEDLGRRTRDYIRSLPSETDGNEAGGPAGMFGQELTSPNAQAIDLVESVEIMLMKLAQLREVFADRV
ncbi:hypothetical protein HDU87_006566 [Geranomyces variabilis]|uniref:PH domain-containing protein n=1 Tax=Geranomyces variabilis TaxID=109894 RepID=A0AAD5XK80_9FUNG|nr:hypothetical protein HDU87_006566 [Geranomyces variabilis]